MENVKNIVFTLLDIAEECNRTVKIFMDDGDAFSHKRNVAGIIDLMKDLEHYVKNEKEHQRYTVTFEENKNNE